MRNFHVFIIIVCLGFTLEQSRQMRFSFAGYPAMFKKNLDNREVLNPERKKASLAGQLFFPVCVPAAIWNRYVGDTSAFHLLHRPIVRRFQRFNLIGVCLATLWVLIKVVEPKRANSKKP